MASGSDYRHTRGRPRGGAGDTRSGDEPVTSECISAEYRDRAQLWRYMQHQEEVQHERMAKLFHIRFVRGDRADRGESADTQRPPR